MNKFKQIACALLILSLINGSLHFVSASDPDVQPETVKKIKKVTFEIQESNPPNLLVSVTGEVPSGGFTGVELTRVSYRQPPRDGIQDYYLKAVPPTQPAIAVISEVKATDTWKGMPFWVKGVRVHGLEEGVQVVLFAADRPRMRPPVRRFTGTSKQGSYDEALKAALADLNQALGEDGVRDATASWKLDSVRGAVGGISGQNLLSVSITARRQPAWKIDPASDTKSKQKKSE